MCILCETKVSEDIERLECSYCDGIDSIPPSFTNLRKLDCDNTPITFLPETLVNLTYLNSSYCEIKFIPETFVNLIKLYVSECPLLECLPDSLINLKHLECYSSSGIQSIPEYPNLQYLNCSDTCITHIPSLKNLKELNCGFCSLLTSISPDLVNLEMLQCNECKLLTTIPDTLVNLTCLYCDDSNITYIPQTLIKLGGIYCDDSKISYIPNTLVNLKDLRCQNCPIKLIPDTLVNLEFLVCDGCRMILSIPETLTKLLDDSCDFWIESEDEKINCAGCPWIDENKDENIRKLIVLQKFVRKNLMFWKFKRWIKSKEGIEWLYHPDNIGGRIVKKSLEKMFIHK